jgi:hypothetical protein
MAGVQVRLAAALAAAWEAEVLSQRTMTELAERVVDRRNRARLLVLSAVCQAHASRLLGRLASLGAGPLPVPPDDLDLPERFSEALRKEGMRAHYAALRYAQVAESCRKVNDPAAAWVCELNRAEEEDRSTELLSMAERAAASGEDDLLPGLAQPGA